jgi:hypothetical protein
MMCGFRFGRTRLRDGIGFVGPCAGRTTRPRVPATVPPNVPATEQQISRDRNTRQLQCAGNPPRERRKAQNPEDNTSKTPTHKANREISPPTPIPKSRRSTKHDARRPIAVSRELINFTNFWRSTGGARTLPAGIDDHPAKMTGSTRRVGGRGERER